MCRYIRPFIFLLLLERATYLLCVRTRANDEIIDKGEREKGKGETETEHALSPFPLSPFAPSCLPTLSFCLLYLLALLAYPSATYIAFPICSARTVGVVEVLPDSSTVSETVLEKEMG